MHMWCSKFPPVNPSVGGWGGLAFYIEPTTKTIMARGQPCKQMHRYSLLHTPNPQLSNGYLIPLRVRKGKAILSAGFKKSEISKASRPKKA